MPANRSDDPCRGSSLFAPPLAVDQFDRWLTTAAISLRVALPG